MVFVFSGRVFFPSPLFLLHLSKRRKKNQTLYENACLFAAGSAASAAVPAGAFAAAAEERLWLLCLWCDEGRHGANAPQTDGAGAGAAAAASAAAGRTAAASSAATAAVPLALPRSRPRSLRRCPRNPSAEGWTQRSRGRGG